MTSSQSVTFVSCNHTSPPTPSPPTKQHSNNCLSCSIAFAKQQSALSLTTYNNLITEKASQYTNNACRVHSTRDQNEIISLGQAAVDRLVNKRNAEIDRVWSKVEREWNGATRAGKRGNSLETLSVSLAKKTSNGLLIPEGVWKDKFGKIVAVVDLKF